MCRVGAVYGKTVYAKAAYGKVRRCAASDVRQGHARILA